MFIALIWKYDFSAFMVLIIAILNDGNVISTEILLLTKSCIHVTSFARTDIHFLVQEPL